MWKILSAFHDTDLVPYGNGIPQAVNQNVACPLQEKVSDRGLVNQATIGLWTSSHGENGMKRSLMLLMAVSALASTSAFAQDAAALAKSKNCLSCHSVQTKLVGPAYKDVAAKYAGQKGAEDKLVQKVIKGGAGVWGQVPMPANPQVSEAEAHTLVKWILAQK
jgi:cytochrome c